MLHAARQLPAWLIFDVGQNSTMRRYIFDFRVGDVRERLIIARRVLFAYPIFAVVALISFVSSEVHWSKVGFLAAGLLYPIVYFVCLDLALALQGGRKEAALRISGMPLWYLAIVAAFGMAALIIDEL